MLKTPIWSAVGVQLKMAGLGLTVFEVIVEPAGALPRLQSRLAGRVVLIETGKVRVVPAVMVVLLIGLITSGPIWAMAARGKPMTSKLRKKINGEHLRSKRTQPSRGDS